MRCAVLGEAQVEHQQEFLHGKGGLECPSLNTALGDEVRIRLELMILEGFSSLSNSRIQ